MSPNITISNDLSPCCWIIQIRILKDRKGREQRKVRLSTIRIFLGRQRPTQVQWCLVTTRVISYGLSSQPSMCMGDRTKNRLKFSTPFASGSCVIHTSKFLSLFQSSLSLSLFSFYLSSLILPASHLLLKAPHKLFSKKPITLCYPPLPRSRERSS